MSQTDRFKEAQYQYIRLTNFWGNRNGEYLLAPVAVTDRGRRAFIRLNDLYSKWIWECPGLSPWWEMAPPLLQLAGADEEEEE